MTSPQVPTIGNNFPRFVTQFQYFVIALVLLSASALPALAQEGRSHTPPSPDTEFALEQNSKAGALLKVVRDSTERFKDFTAAQHEGYALTFGCVSGPDFGAMGLHFVNGDLVKNGILDATRPQIVIYEPTPGGELKITGADYLLIASQWDAQHSGPPELMGQIFQYFESPNRFGLPAFYTLHVWAWKDNPNGAFVNWHPNVRCEMFPGQLP